MKNVSVILKGRIVSIEHHRDMDAVILVTNVRIAEFPRIIFTGEERALLDGFKENEYVDIMATIDNYPLRRGSAESEDGDNTNFHQRITGKSIKHSVSETMKYFGEDFGTYESENRVVTSGRLHVIRKRSRRIDVAVKPNDSDETIRMSCYSPALISRIEDMDEDAQVYILGEIHTRLMKATEKTRRRVFETMTISNIQ